MRERFPFAVASSYRRAERLLGIDPDRALVEVGDGRFYATFGRWKVDTPLDNVGYAEITGPYRFVMTAGPARYAFTDQGLTFATNGDRGVRVDFRAPVKGLVPLGLVRHPELTVTVADTGGLYRLLMEHVRAHDR